MPSDLQYPLSTYIICTNPRSGSWLLSEGLASTSIAGNPREWFHSLEEQRFKARWNIENSIDADFPTYLAHVRAESKSTNGVSGIKIHYYQFVELTERLGAIEGWQGLTPAQMMESAFPGIKYVFLTRRDKARQAISYHLACQTNDWWMIDGVTPNGPKGRVDESGFDAQAIARLENVLVENDRKWQVYFSRSHLVPLTVHYEDLAADYRGTIVGILRWLELPGTNNDAIKAPRLKKQSTSLNEDWLKRYVEFKAAGILENSAAPELVSPLLERSQKPFDKVPDAWQEWIAHKKLTKTPDDRIVEVLMRNGYSRESALGEIEKASSSPYLAGAARSRGHLARTASLVGVLDQLHRLDPRGTTIERRSNLSTDEFRDRYYAANRPVLIEGLMAGWKAPTAWTQSYLKNAAGETTIEIMADRHSDPKYEINASKHRSRMRFSDYVDMVYSGTVTNDFYLVANNTFFQMPGMRVFLDDINSFPEFLKPIGDGRQCFLWIGPAGTVTPLHHDLCNVLFAQVTGRKRFRLIPALQREFVYNSVGVFSDVDCENPDLDRHPQFRHATPIEVEVAPGDVLFIPVGWWHHVRALDVSISVSFTDFLFPNRFQWEV